MGKILGAVFAVLAAFNLILGVRCIMLRGAGADAIAGEAVFLDSAEPDPANEGKLVVVTGTVKQDTPAYDEKYGLTLNVPLAVRESSTVYTEAYDKDKHKIYGSDLDAYYDPSDTEHRLEDLQIKYLFDYDDIEYIYGAASTGGFSLSEEMMIPLNKGVADQGIGYDEDEIRAAGLFLRDDSNGYYLSNRKDGALREGDLKLTYSYANPDPEETYTFIGRQSGSTLEKAADANLSQWVYEGRKTKDELIGNEKKSGIAAIVFFFALTLLFTALALWKFEVFDRG